MWPSAAALCKAPEDCPADGRVCVVPPLPACVWACQVVKLPCPPPLHRTQEEWDALVSGAWAAGGLASLINTAGACWLCVPGSPLKRSRSEHRGSLPPPLHTAPQDETGRANREPGERLAASYVNFYIANGGVVMPAFGVPEADAAAQAVLERAFPERQVVAVPTREIVLGGGNIHCITQQEPELAAAVAAAAESEQKGV